MPIHYDFYPAKGLKGTRDELFVRPISNQTTGMKEIAHAIEHATSATAADTKLVLSALSAAVIDELLKGNRVHLDGLGYFSISMKGEVARDKNGRPLLKNAGVRDILFQPERQMLASLGNARFTAADHRGRRSSGATEADVMRALRKLGADGAVFSSAKFRSELGLTVSTANRLLRRLREEGVVENIGTRNSLLLRLREA
ncbi:MAG: HU family DNA-binding protein [Alloprevotella sp.]|nr:HU family DNA-binding protein [Alloprevotella sp.]MBR1645098.1 HU family DNA-binding protein [Bacteroidales bacterium]MBR1652620.1 HU family DNA-binding protein [Alloprevotella sp.]